MPQPIAGLHHVTAIASDPQRNLDFYTQILGLRFVKRTVNFDDPGSYHFYFGDADGAPGTILTFFAWPMAARGASGVGETVATSFSVPPDSLQFWEGLLARAGVPVEPMFRRFDEPVLAFYDPDGMKIEVVGHASARKANMAAHLNIPPEHAIRGFFGATLCEQSAEGPAQTLASMGFQKIAEQGNRIRFCAAGQALGAFIDILIHPDVRPGKLGAGSIHHIAFRASDNDSQLEWQSKIGQSLDVTPVMDRSYFRSIYFREPGGVLFEVATDPPGFTFDEAFETLGEGLKLPDWLEPRRAAIERALPPIRFQGPSLVRPRASKLAKRA